MRLAAVEEANVAALFAIEFNQRDFPGPMTSFAKTTAMWW